MAHQVNNLQQTIISLMTYRASHGGDWKSKLHSDFFNGNHILPCVLNQFRNIHLQRLSKITNTMSYTEILQILLVNVNKVDMDQIRSDLKKMWKHDHSDYIGDYISTLENQGYKLTSRQLDSLYNVEGRN